MELIGLNLSAIICRWHIKKCLNVQITSMQKRLEKSHICNMLWEIYRNSNTLIWFLCFLLSCEKPAKESLKINKRKICTVGYIIYSAKSFLYSLRTFLLRSRLFKTRLSDFFRLVTQFINFTILCKFTFFYLL